MSRRTIHALVTAGAMSIGAVLAGQVPSTTGADIVVRAGTPRMIAGLWRFHASAVTTDTLPGQSIARGRGPQDWTLCIADGDTPAVLEQLIGAKAVFDEGGLCSRMGLTITRNHVNGSRRCPMPPMETSDGEIMGLVADTRMRARIAPARLTADYTLQVARPADTAAKTRWTVSAQRTGDCDATATPPLPEIARAVVPSPFAPSTAIVRSDAAVADDEPVDGPLPGTSGHPDAMPPVAASPSSGSKAAPQADDIVVVARKLRRIRLHYNSSGRAMRWCHADISSGDARLDRIGCALVRICVREGNSDRASALACFNRRIDSLDLMTGPLPRPVLPVRDSR